MPTSPKAETMPGGASLKRASSKRPCKYGPRDSDGRCPPKPKAASKPSKSAASKRPCKYGPRGADGLCPKKPKAARSERAPTVKDYSSVDSAARQAGEVLRSKKATGSQKKEAVKVLGAAVAAEAGKKIAEEQIRSVKKELRKPAVKKAIQKAAKDVGIPAAKATLVGAAIAGTLAAGGAALTANRAKQARAFADRELAKSKKRLGAALTPAMAKTLWQQYYDHALKAPVTNSFSGK